MEFVEVQGERIPAIGLGTWQMQGEKCRRAVENALELGYRHIDTAQAYNNEQQVGTAIADSDVDRDEIWLTIKIWRTNLDPDSLVTSFQQSLEKLQTDYVDLLLIHWPNPSVPLEETLQTMETLMGDGSAHNIGVSNFAAEHIERAWQLSDKPILTDQVEYHPFLNQDKILRECIDRDMMLTAYSPLARGDVVGNDVLRDIGTQYNKSAAQVALRWLVQQENVAAIPKATKPEHQKANISIFDFELTSREMEEIKKLTENSRRKVNPSFAPDWD